MGNNFKTLRNAYGWVTPFVTKCDIQTEKQDWVGGVEKQDFKGYVIIKWSISNII